MMEGVVTTAAIKHAKLQSNRHHQQTSIACAKHEGCNSAPLWGDPLYYYGRTLSDASMLYFADVFLYFFL